MQSDHPIFIHEEVKEALQSKKGVVALESTIFTHGLPFPENIETAKRLDAVIRKEGAVPALIAIIEGVLHIGIDGERLESFIRSPGVIRKVSRKDLPYVLCKKENGSTTVSATMIAAKLTGIRVFATGGLGGVHLEAEKTFDISADLTELSKTPVAVVCSGAKSILDIPKTLEVLETLGVPIYGYRTKFFPEFYCTGKTHPLEMTFDTLEEISKALKVQWELGLNSGAVIANPIPLKEALDEKAHEKWVNEAHLSAKSHGISGKSLTPFLLKEIALRSSKQSVKANLALIESNACLAARLSLSLHE